MYAFKDKANKMFVGEAVYDAANWTILTRHLDLERVLTGCELDDRCTRIV